MYIESPFFRTLNKSKTKTQDMLISKKDGQLVQIVDVSGKTATIQEIKRNSEAIHYGEPETVDLRLIPEPCVTDSLEVARKYHQVS